MEVFDLDVAAAGTNASGGEFHQASSTVFSACATESDHFRAGGQERVGDEVVDELWSSGSVEDDVLHAGMQAVQVEDLLGGRGIAQALTLWLR
ncbi:hypothetical protein AB0F17_41215 [Nonomuraea sp. NPDC026600]|uniref:hypothetical protein n=1 Tax=Nonomuraea sp. NPDC026600 TaxID=3155363 RepID=UPI0033C4D340